MSQSPAKPLVDVVLPVGPGIQPYAARALESTLLSRGVDFRVLVILDGRESLPAGMCKVADSRVQVFRNYGPNGVANAMNLGLSLCSAPFLAVMHSDDVCHPQRLAIQADVLKAHNEIVAIGAYAVSFTDGEGPTRFDEVERYCLDHISWTQIIRSNPLTDPTTMMRTDALMKCGGYNGLMTSMQDYELLLRLSCQGEVANVEVPLLWYRIHSGQFSRRRRAVSEWSALRRARRQLASCRSRSAAFGDCAHWTYMVNHGALSLSCAFGRLRVELLKKVLGPQSH